MNFLYFRKSYWNGLVTLMVCFMLIIATNCPALGKETAYDLNGNGIVGDPEDMLLQSKLEKKIQYVLNGLGYWAVHQFENGFWGNDIQLTSMWVDSKGTVHAEVSMFKYLDGSGYPEKNELKKYEFYLKSDGILIVRDLNTTTRPIAGLLVGEHAFISVASIEDLNGNLEFADNEDVEIALDFIYRILDLPKKADSIDKFASTTKYSVESIEALGPFNVPGPYNLRTQVTKVTTYPIMPDGTQTTVTDHYVYTLKTDGTLYVQYLGWEKVIQCRC